MPELIIISTLITMLTTLDSDEDDIRTINDHSLRISISFSSCYCVR